jgi:hypothetical protein
MTMTVLPSKRFQYPRSQETQATTEEPTTSCHGLRQELKLAWDPNEAEELSFAKKVGTRAAAKRPACGEIFNLYKKSGS